jgi:hypothetical protein
MNTVTTNGTARFDSLRAAVVFPNRKSVHPREVANVLSISVDQVTILKDAGYLEALPISIGGDRCHYRITVASYDQFVVNGGTQHLNKNGHSRNGHGKNGHSRKARR